MLTVRQPHGNRIRRASTRTADTATSSLMASIRNTPSNNRRIKRHTLALNAVPLPSETCNSIISGRGSVKTTSPPCRHGDNLVFRINRHSRRIADTSEKRRPITRHILNIALRYLRYNTSPINSVDHSRRGLLHAIHRRLRASHASLRIIGCGDVSVLHIGNQTQRDSQGINLALTRGSRLQVGFFNLRNLPDGIP